MENAGSGARESGSVAKGRYAGQAEVVAPLGHRDVAPIAVLGVAFSAGSATGCAGPGSGSSAGGNGVSGGSPSVRARRRRLRAPRGVARRRLAAAAGRPRLRRRAACGSCRPRAAARLLLRRRGSVRPAGRLGCGSASSSSSGSRPSSSEGTWIVTLRPPARGSRRRRLHRRLRVGVRRRRRPRPSAASSASSAVASPSVAPAAPAVFFRLRPPREPRRVFFFAASPVGGSGLVGGRLAGVVSLVGSRRLRRRRLERRRLLPSTSSPRPSGVRLRRPSSAVSAASAPAVLRAGGLRVGFSASLSAVIGSGAFAARRDERRVRDAVEHALDANLDLLADELRRFGDADVEAVDLADARAGVVPVDLDELQLQLCALLDRRRRREVFELALGEHDEVIEVRVRLRPRGRSAASSAPRARCSRAAPGPIEGRGDRRRDLDAVRLRLREPAASARSRRSMSIAADVSERTMPSPPQVGHFAVMISRGPSVTFWRVISTRPSGEISTT